MSRRDTNGYPPIGRAVWQAQQVEALSGQRTPLGYILKLIPAGGLFSGILVVSPVILTKEP